MATRAVWTCDVCGKEETVPGSGYSPPHAPWATVSIQGFYYDKYKDRLDRIGGVCCGAECIKELLTKALIAVEEIEEWQATPGAGGA